MWLELNPALVSQRVVDSVRYITFSIFGKRHHYRPAKDASYLKQLHPFCTIGK